MGKAINTPLIYFGGKSLLASTIVNLLPPHRVFVDVFGGGGSIILAKEPSFIDVYNDIGFVAKFFAALRDEEKSDMLHTMLRLTPFSRWEYQDSLSWKYECDEIEKLRKWFVLINQGFRHVEYDSGWIGVGTGANHAESWANHVDDIPAVAERFRRINVENLSYPQVIDRYDSPETLFYCDPPYIGSGRTSTGRYTHEMDRASHLYFIGQIRTIKGQAVVSMYPDEMYEKELRGWRLIKIDRKSQIHNNSQAENAGIKTECIWIKEHCRGIWDETTWERANVPQVSSEEAKATV